jgi:hypothetical protein
MWAKRMRAQTAASDLEAKAAADPERPQFHLLPGKKNWTNDPNGPIYFNGKYHMGSTTRTKQRLTLSFMRWAAPVSV